MRSRISKHSGIVTPAGSNFELCHRTNSSQVGDGLGAAHEFSDVLEAGRDLHRPTGVARAGCHGDRCPRSSENSAVHNAGKRRVDGRHRVTCECRTRHDQEGGPQSDHINQSIERNRAENRAEITATRQDFNPKTTSIAHRKSTSRKGNHINSF